MINYAVVGAGWIAQEAFLPGVAQSGNSRVTAIVTGDRAKAARLADFYGIEAIVGYDGYDALLASRTIDAVYIALPNHMHADYAIRAARAGKHVMVEKPLAVSEDEALAMIAAARRANVFLMTAYRLHHEPGTVAVLEHIRADAIGRPLFFQSVFSFQTATGKSSAESDGVGRAASGCRRLLHQRRSSHLCGRADRGHRRWRTGRPTTRALARWPPRWPRCCDFPLAASHNSSPVSARRTVDNYRVVGTSGDLELDPGFRFETATRLRLRRDGKVVETQFPQIDHFGAQVGYFSDCIRSGTPPEADGEEGLADMRALIAIEKAASTGIPQAIFSSAAVSSSNSRHGAANSRNRSTSGSLTIGFHPN